MFRGQTIVALFLLTTLTGLSLYQMVFLHSSDVKHFQKLLQEKEIASSYAPSPTTQYRKQVRKDIWFSQDDSSRLHYQIASQGSLLTLVPIKNKFEIVEALQEIKCWMQDKLYTENDPAAPMQQTRYIEAKEGYYRYTTQAFTANDVTLSLFNLPGHALPKESVQQNQAFLTGIAQDISFLFSNKTPQFQAHQFQARMVKE